MADYLSLDDAAKKLGIPTDRLVELRSQGQVRGFRDGASWKFPENEIERLADELPDLMSSGSGILVDESDVGSAIGSGSGSVIGGEEPAGDDGSGSDIGVGGETDQSGSGSDVNLVAAEGDGSDVQIVASDSDGLLDSGESDLVELDSAELQLAGPAVGDEKEKIDLSLEPQEGSTGPVTDEELKEISDSQPDALQSDSDAAAAIKETDVSISADDGPADDGPADDGGGESKQGASEMDLLGSDIELKSSGLGASGDILSSSGVSSLELMSDLDSMSEPSDVASMGSRGANVLSELDLVGGKKEDSGLITGDSQADALSAPGSSDSGLGSGIKDDNIQDSELSGIGDALDDDDELIISDDDDDLVLEDPNSGGSIGSDISDISVAGESGINLMSPSDSGLSLEAEPQDLGGSSISALDLGAELAEGSGSGGGSGSGVDFQGDEEFQLSPSGIGLEADIDSGSQVIEVEDSGDVAEAVDVGDDPFAEAEPLAEDDAFAAEAVGDDGGFGDDAAVAVDETAAPVGAPAARGYEIPFSLMQCVGLMMILVMMTLSGMLLTDLVRNMWAYNEVSAPVSSLTDTLISIMGWNT